jgi:hypothetical protein
MESHSCDVRRLYATGGFYDEGLSDVVLDAPPLGKWVGNVYPAYAYARSLPARIFSERQETAGELIDQYRRYDARLPTGPPSELFALERAILYDRSLYAAVPPGKLVQLYETNRGIDRPWKTELDESLLSSCRRPRRSDADYLYFSSVGSENYAHWLIDDLTRIKGAIDHLDPARTVIVLDAYFPQIDDIRVQSIRAVSGTEWKPEILFVDKKEPYFFDRLIYASPVSYQPILKSPQAVEFLYERLHDDAADTPKKLFVARAALWRNVLNADEVARFFVDRDFALVTIGFGTMPFLEQVRLFSNAEVVVGVAGASMVNTVFTPPGARVGYLAGTGFSDPWYWDLSVVKRHEYSVSFGTPWEPEQPNFSSFHVRESELRALFDGL